VTELEVGILALQGDYAAHERAVRALGHRARAVKSAEPLDEIQALLLPGGESTTMLRILEDEQLVEPLAAWCRSGRPVLGTCAGAILLAKEVTGPRQASLGIVDMDIERNAYGRQLDSFVATIEDAPAELVGFEAVFIRAPVIRRTGEGVEVLMRHGGHPVLVRQGPVHAATFHPEMTTDLRVLQLVLAGQRT
jgi:5'-phosphate synthase pdxT subunit